MSTNGGAPASSNLEHACSCGLSLLLLGPYLKDCVRMSGVSANPTKHVSDIAQDSQYKE
jgi:hypothetical protein